MKDGECHLCYGSPALVREMRSRFGSQSRFAMNLGFSKQMIDSYIKGVHIPSFNNAIKIFNRLNSRGKKITLIKYTEMLQELLTHE